MQNEEFQIGTIKGIECFKEAWELIKAQYWLLFAIAIVGMMIGGATMYILLGAMICGIYLCYLTVIDGGEIKFDLLFKGFSQFVPGLIVTIFMIVPIITLYILIYVPVIVGAIMAENRVEQETILPIVLGIIAIDFIFIVGMVCFHTLLMFAYPLIVDRNLSGFAAMRLSAKAVWKNLGGVTSLILVNMVVSFAGMAALCIGIYFALPLMLAANTVAYRKVFPRQKATAFAPPPPNAYQGL